MALFDASYSMNGHAVIVEVGTFFGRSAVLLAGARMLRGSGKVHCIDPFDGSGDVFSVPAYRSILEERGGGSLRAYFEATLKRAGLMDWVEIHEGTATDVAAGWSGGIDLLLLDADHSPKGARDAFDAWAPHLKPGGIIVLDNSIPRTYAANHDGNRRVAVEEIIAPHYEAIRHIGSATFARRAATARFPRV
jgi:MMP 1-O-methyltransferase